MCAGTHRLDFNPKEVAYLCGRLSDPKGVHTQAPGFREHCLTRGLCTCDQLRIPRREADVGSRPVGEAGLQRSPW